MWLGENVNLQHIRRRINTRSIFIVVLYLRRSLKKVCLYIYPGVAFAGLFATSRSDLGGTVAHNQLR